MWMLSIIWQNPLGISVAPWVCSAIMFFGLTVTVPPIQHDATIRKHVRHFIIAVRTS
jgi:hypothetical protein